MREDVTSKHLIREDIPCRAHLLARQNGVMAGGFLLPQMFEALPDSVELEIISDGSTLESGDKVGTLTGPARTLLAGERVAINFLQRLSGIATLTKTFVERVANTSAQILDTRKTTPGWRHLEKYAVRAGGGHNHRMDLSEMMLVKENHIEILSHCGERLSEYFPLEPEDRQVPVQVEVEDPGQISDVIDLKPDYLLLDNFTPPDLERALERIQRETSDGAGSIVTEASGNIRLENVRAYAQTGVDRISVGSLTHSAPAMDYSMQIEKVLS